MSSVIEMIDGGDFRMGNFDENFETMLIWLMVFHKPKKKRKKERKREEERSRRMIDVEMINPTTYMTDLMKRAKKKKIENSINVVMMI